MKRGVPGHGAVSIILVFTVLCLTLFAVITFSQASADKALADAATRMVLGYYNADTLAELVLAGLNSEAALNGPVLGVNITVTDMGPSSLARFSIPVTEGKELVVEALILQPDKCEILKWKMEDVGAWEPDIYHPLLDVDNSPFNFNS